MNNVTTSSSSMKKMMLRKGDYMVDESTSSGGLGQGDANASPESVGSTQASPTAFPSTGKTKVGSTLGKSAKMALHELD